jgi:hypothetical protein
MVLMIYLPNALRAFPHVLGLEKVVKVESNSNQNDHKLQILIRSYLATEL